MRLQVRRLAREDIESAFAWYFERDEDAAVHFVDEVEHVLARIPANPNQFPEVHRGTRRALLKHFPYAIYFRVQGDVATIVAVMHQRQAPSQWKHRS